MPVETDRATGGDYGSDWATLLVVLLRAHSALSISKAADLPMGRGGSKVLILT